MQTSVISETKSSVDQPEVSHFLPAKISVCTSSSFFSSRTSHCESQISSNICALHTQRKQWIAEWPFLEPCSTFCKDERLKHFQRFQHAGRDWLWQCKIQLPNIATDPGLTRGCNIITGPFWKNWHDVLIFAFLVHKVSTLQAQENWVAKWTVLVNPQSGGCRTI